MADNVNSSVAVGDGPDFATKDILGVHYPRNILTTPAGVDIIPLSEGGSVSVSNHPVSYPVTGTFWQATQPVSLASTTISGSVAVTGVFFQATQPVSIAATVAVSGPLTDAQLRAVAVPVSGTFWQATQPVSGTVTVNVISGFATEATLAARIPVNGQALMAASVPVTLASNQSALPVTGTFWQATQPVSIASMPTTPVTGTFWQATQPVSLTSTTITGSVAVTGTFWQATQPVSLASTTITGTVAVTAPTLTKGTQSANGFSVQDLKDSGRVIFSASTVIAGVTAVTTEALLSMVATRDGVAAAAATTFAVTANKRLRLQIVIGGLLSTAAATISGRLALRMNPSGAVAATSPILAIIDLHASASLAQAGESICVPIPDGLEFSGTQQFGLTQIGSVATGTFRASIVGYEY